MAKAQPSWDIKESTDGGIYLVSENRTNGRMDSVEFEM